VKVKHSKYKNTGLIFELLVKQIAADTLSRKDSPAVKILKKFYTGNTSLVKEFKLYDFVLKNKGIGQRKAEAILSTIVELSRKIEATSLNKQKYELIKELKSHYNLEDFFSIKVESYKPLAALYCLLEAQNTEGLVDPQVFVDNKTTLLEHFLQTKQDANNAKDTLIEEYSKYDKDLRLLTYKILLEKFNNKYDNLLPEQKNILKEFIISANSTTKLRALVNEELGKIQVQITKLKPKVEDQIVKIKLDEVSKAITPVKNTEKVTDNHLVSLMQYYELVGELKKV
jgi:ribosomal protein S13